jgi:hypothetical protein
LASHQVRLDAWPRLADMRWRPWLKIGVRAAIVFGEFAVGIQLDRLVAQPAHRLRECGKGRLGLITVQPVADLDAPHVIEEPRNLAVDLAAVQSLDEARQLVGQLEFGVAHNRSASPPNNAAACRCLSQESARLLVLGLRLREVGDTALIDRCRAQPRAIPGQSLPRSEGLPYIAHRSDQQTQEYPDHQTQQQQRWCPNCQEH